VAKWQGVIPDDPEAVTGSIPRVNAFDPPR
jgi:hypothetical protein